MCGISGFVGLKDVAPALIESIKRLEYRGYDSCGIALMDGSDSIKTRKNIGAVDDVRTRERFDELSGTVGIGHTRWATHGGVTKENAHPHLSCCRKFAVTHNGILNNYTTMRENLRKKGHTFTSETDTEVIVHLIEEHYKETRNVERAFQSACRELDGTFGMTLISTHAPGKIFCARKESPLIIGLGANTNYVGSDFNAFIPHTKSAILLDDNEYAIVTHDGYTLKKIQNGERVNRKVMQIQWDPEMAQKGGFPHFMLKEIYEQPQTVRNALDIDQTAINDLADAIIEKEEFTLTGVGTTFYVVQLGQYFFSEYAGITPKVVSSDEFLYLSSVNRKSLVLATSQSGETYDTITALRSARKAGAETAAIINVMGSSLSRMVDHMILQGSGPEISVISTKAALSQMVILLRLALEVGVRRKKITKRNHTSMMKQLRSLPGLIETVLNEKSGFIHGIAKDQAHIEHWLFLGRGRFYPVARESALKMKEVSYVHAEGMPSGFLKHGTIALIDDNLNSVIFMPPDEEEELYDKTLSAAEEIRARNGYTLGLCFESRKKRELPFSDTIMLPKTPPLLAPLIEIVAAQLLSYYTATTLKRNIDRPRALAKSVTVA